MADVHGLHQGVPSALSPGNIHYYYDNIEEVYISNNKNKNSKYNNNIHT